jgi:hypothetical protein
MGAKIVNTETGKETKFDSVEEAQKQAQFDETYWPCDVVTDDGTVIAHFEE